MREIIFRGKRIDNGEWVYGDIVHHDGKISYVGQHPADGSMVVHDLIPDTVGQYTGLKDKNGKEIFEGDIIHWDWEKIPYLVYWSDNTCQFTTDMRWLWSSIENVEILGNIRDNPELLEVEK